MKDLDLVIKKPKNMMKLVRFLIHAMETIDGNKGSSVQLKKSVFDQKQMLSNQSSVFNKPSQIQMKQ